MKLRYTVFAAVLIMAFGLLALAGTGGLKDEFFTAQSLLDANDLKLFDGSFTHDRFTKYDFEIKDGDFSVSYTVYTEDFNTYYVESKDNFDFVIKCGKSAHELKIPWELIEYFQNCKRYNRRFSSVYDGIAGILKRSTNESDFSSRTSVIDYNGLSRRSNAITLELKDLSEVSEEFRKYFSSDDMAKLLNELYGADCTSAQLGDMLDNTFMASDGSLLYKRSVVSDVAYEETVTIRLSDNTFNIKIANGVVDHEREGSISVSDSKKTVDFSLDLSKNDEGEAVVIKNGDTYTEIKAKDRNSITYFSKNGNCETKMTVSTLADVSFGDCVYNLAASSQRNLMLCELSPWLTSNGNAALLFNTYEVALKPLKIDLEDLKINFDE